MIRLATVDDADALMRMGEAFHIEAGHPFPFDAESFAHSMALLGPAGLVLVSEHAGQPVGMGVVVMAPALSNFNVLLAKEVIWYIVPEHRKGLGQELLKALEEIAMTRGVAFFHFVAEEGKRSSALARIYRAAGYSPAETTFRKRLECSHSSLLPV